MLRPDPPRRPLPEAVARQNAIRAAMAAGRLRALRPRLERMWREGLGPRAMARQLAADGVLSPVGGPITAHYIGRNLRRLKLTGGRPSCGPRHGAAVAAGLQLARLRGGGDPGNSPGAIAARVRRAEAAQARAEALREVVTPLHRDGLSLAAIAAALNSEGLTSTGNRMTVCSARALLQRLGLPTGRDRLPADRQPSGQGQGDQGQ